MGATVLTAVLGVHAAQRSSVVRLLDAQHETASIEEGVDDLAGAAVAAVRRAGASRLVLDCPSSMRAHDVLALCSAHGGPLASDVALGAIVAVVAADRLLEVLAEDVDLIGWDGIPTDRPLGVVAVEQIEHASTVLVVDSDDSEDLGAVLALLAHLNPRARIAVVRDRSTSITGVVASAGAGGVTTPGWLHLLNDEFDPEISGHGIGAVRYQNLRPFHPERLQRLMSDGLERRFGTLIRSAGLCRFATRPGRIARWDQVGPIITFELAGRDTSHPSVEPLCLGQELALIGRDLDADGLTAALDACVLTDGELADGPLVWLTYPDPFPSWEHAARQQQR